MIVESCGKSTFSFVRNNKSILQNGHTICVSTGKNASSYSMFLSAFGGVFWILAMLIGVQWYLVNCFHLHYPNDI